MPDLHVVEELKAYLLAQGVGVAPTSATAAKTVLPTIWLDPRDGAPQPRWSDRLEDYLEDATITLVDQQLSGPNLAEEAYLEEAFIDVIVRSRNAAAGKLIHRQIRGLIHPIGALHGKRLWLMNDLLIQVSTIWRSEQKTGATEVDYSRTASYRFQTRRKSLAGQNYAP